MNFKFKPTTNKKQHSSAKRSLNSIKFIVIHDTGNPSKGADSLMHWRYVNGLKNRFGSAHYYLDDKQIIQVVGDSYSAWSVGDTWAKQNRTRNDVKNSNSISIELCINSDSNHDMAYRNLVELTKNLMRQFNIGVENVVRHFDASGKPCPNSWKANNWAKWWQFKEDIKKPIVWAIDLSKDSVFGDEAGNTSTKQQKPVTDDSVKPNSESKGDIVMNKEYVQPEWAKEPWEWAKANGITDGSNPQAPATREEVVVMLKRVYDLGGMKNERQSDNSNSGSARYSTGI